MNDDCVKLFHAVNLIQERKAGKAVLAGSEAQLLRGLHNLDKVAGAAFVSVVTTNRVFESIILPVLHRIDYDPESLLAIKWHLSDSVVLNPRICFGKPIVEAVGITTHVLAASFIANAHDAKAVSDWFSIEEKHVLAAVEFEKRFAA